ncbi:hypothetical protein HYDPIDRAFT_120128 [Hydnomerulius pinastri MD-312]|uniref:Uncharacterized protein n=1 Tax=Hydnomerulius pinastri MD-312 TaxID=994086 RepID=A0A0C9VKD5_9AGAM|nr:hypothetical protein HYDPIDRAFT_120128 [Hydnomerulius pinastri MD-312]
MANNLLHAPKDTITVYDPQGIPHSFIQAEDQFIYEITKYNDRDDCHAVPLPGPKARPGTPIAAVALGNSGGIRVYYIGEDNRLYEMCIDSRGWYSGIGSSRFGYVAPGSDLLYAMARVKAGGHVHLKVGFQSANAPQNVITEATFWNEVWHNELVSISGNSIR